MTNANEEGQRSLLFLFPASSGTEMGAWLTSLTLHLSLLLAMAALTFALPHAGEDLSLVYEELED